MRALCTFAGGEGHLQPLLPLARALRRRGHEVAFSAQPAMLHRVRSAGFPAFDSGGDTLADPAVRAPLLPVDRAHEEAVVRNSFAGRIARVRARTLIDVATTWHTDVVVHDEMDFGAVVAAEHVGVPHVGVVVLAAGTLVRPDLVAEPLDALRAQYALAPDPDLTSLHRHLTLVPAPPSFRSPEDPLPATARHLRPAVLDAAPAVPGSAPVLEWLRRHDDRRTVYLTLGTVFHQESGDLFARALSGLAELDVNVVVTVGREIDPDELGPRPGNVRVERYLPQALLLPHCDAVVCHGGSGSVIGALSFGIPLVLLPMGADQPLNADRCTALGVARVLDPVTTTGHQIAAAAHDVLDAPSYRGGARVLADEVAALPGVEEAAGWVEQLPTVAGAVGALDDPR